MKVIVVKNKQIITHPVKLKPSKSLSKDENKLINQKGAKTCEKGSEVEHCDC